MTVESLTRTTARRIAVAATAEAERAGEHVCVVVLGRLGHVLAAECSEQAPLASFDVALAKAQHARRFDRPTGFQDELVSQGTLQVLAVPGMLPLAGGCPLISEGAPVGAIGVSGAAAPRDEEIARVAAGRYADAPPSGELVSCSGQTQACTHAQPPSRRS